MHRRHVAITVALLILAAEADAFRAISLLSGEWVPNRLVLRCLRGVTFLLLQQLDDVVSVVVGRCCVLRSKVMSLGCLTRATMQEYQQDDLLSLKLPRL